MAQGNKQSYNMPAYSSAPESANWSHEQYLVKEFFKSTKRSKEFPESGRRPPELQDTNHRELIVGPCRVFYRVEKNKIYILYVMRSEQELRKLLLEDRKKDSR